MITSEQIDEWIREAENRPSSALLLIRFISNRLNDLTKWNEELQAENLALRTEKKVEEYENRISSLEYQLGLLKRQLGGEIDFGDIPAITIQEEPSVDLVNLLIYNPQGQVLRLELPISGFAEDVQIGRIVGEVSPGNLPIRLLLVPQSEELLFTFDSGRTVTMPVTDMPGSTDNSLDWQQAYLQTPLGTEELAFIKPIGRMSLYEYCVQISRKGCVKKIREPAFETYLGKSYIGTGIKSTPDKTCDLVLCNKNSQIILASKEGFLTRFEVDPLPTTIEEVIRLNITDHIVITLPVAANLPDDTSLVFITQNGKVIQRQLDWVELPSSFKTKAQAIFSEGRRSSGVRLVTAGLSKPTDWGIALHSDGTLAGYPMSSLIGSGTLMSGDDQGSILGFAIYSPR